jgi:hypothetical protein
LVAGTDVRDLSDRAKDLSVAAIVLLAVIGRTRDRQSSAGGSVCVAEPSVTLQRYCPTMYRAAFIRVVLMTIAAVAVGVAAFLIASVVLEWL